MKKMFVLLFVIATITVATTAFCSTIGPPDGIANESSIQLTEQTVQSEVAASTAIIRAGEVVLIASPSATKPYLANYSPKKGMVADEKTIIYKGAVFRNVCLLEVRLI